MSREWVTVLMPRLSIIVPVYNTENYLRQCIDSILAQTFRDFELILVNDGSTDESGRICDSYARLDGRVCVIHQQNAGVTAARKRGVEQATGAYITFVDSDDWIDPQMYRMMLEQLPADIVVCNMFGATKSGITALRFGIKPGHYDKQGLKEMLYPSMLFDYTSEKPGISPSLCDKLIRSDIVKKIIPIIDDEVTYGEDILCSCLCLLEAEHVCVMEQPLYYYRRDLSMGMDSEDEGMFSKLFLLGTELFRLLSKRDPDAMHQIHGYLARHSLECIRSELLFRSTATDPERRNAALEYLRKPMVSAAFAYALRHMQDWKTRLKMRLALGKRLGILAVLYKGRYFFTGRGRDEN